MTEEAFYAELKSRFQEVAEKNQLLYKKVEVTCKSLAPEEAIGNTKRQDYPILTGKDVMLQARVNGGIGQSFTLTPGRFQGNLKEVLELDIRHNLYDRNIFVAVLNGVMRSLGLCDHSIHCKNDGPELCARQMLEWIKSHYESPKIALVGYQPAILESLSGEFSLRVLDLNPANIGKMIHTLCVEDGEEKYEEVILHWADLVLCTGSTIGNGTIVKFMDLDKEVIFYGTSVAGAAPLMGLKRLCFAD